MRKRVSVLVALVGAAILALVAIGAMGASAADRSVKGNVMARFAGDSDSAASAAVKGADRWVIIEREGRATFIDADQSGGESEGDVFVFSNPLFSTDGERIGRDWGECTLQFGFAVHCKVTGLFFGRGTLEVAGTLNENHDHLAITGGTGEWADAGGEVRVGNTRLFFTILHLH